jgi:hypothetical protein
MGPVNAFMFCENRANQHGIYLTIALLVTTVSR